MAKKLTTKFVENVKPSATTRIEIPDAGCAGLYLILQPSGHKSWAVRYRFGKAVKLTLGPWPKLSLLDARVAATEARKQVAKGVDPAKAKADEKIKADAATANTVTAICENYLKREGGRLRTLDQRVSILRRLIYPALGEMPIETVKRSDIVRLLDKVEDRNGPRAADMTLAVLRKIMNWHATRSDNFVPPFVRGMARQRPAEHRRTRILTDDEIRAVWQATGDGSPFSALIRFLLLTSARRNEAARMNRSEVGTVRCTVKRTEMRNGRESEREVEIDVDGVWTLPASRSKTKAEVVRPLSEAALAVLDGLPQIDGCDYPFTSNGSTPIRQFSDSKRKLDEASGVTGWRLHDLRRTARSLLSRSGVPGDHAEKYLGHSRGDIVERYDQFDYIEPMKRAAEALSALVARIVNPPEGEVADMAAERSKRWR
jgi:integrase